MRFSTVCHKPRSARRTLSSVVVAAVVALNLGSSLARGQEGHHKVPVIDKVTSGAGSRQAFTGKVQSLDLKAEVLSVVATEGVDTEFFPIKKGRTHVEAANGERISITDLAPGTSVIVYYELKSDRRTVTKISVLKSGPSEKEKKKEPAPPS